MRKFLLVLMMLGLIFCNCNAAWDNTTNFQTVAPATAIQKLQDNFTAAGGTAGGVLLPSGAAFYMFSGNCPAGTTDVTSTYSNKFVRINAVQLSTGGADTHTHTLSGANLPTHSHDITVYGNSGESGPRILSTSDSVVKGTYTTASSGSGTAFTGDNVPAYVTAKMCQVQ